MEYILISTKDKSETAFFMDLLKKLQKQPSTLSAKDMEDFAFLAAMKEGEASGKGDLANVKEHLAKVIASR